MYFCVNLCALIYVLIQKLPFSNCVVVSDCTLGRITQESWKWLSTLQGRKTQRPAEFRSIHLRGRKEGALCGRVRTYYLATRTVAFRRLQLDLDGPDSVTRGQIRGENTSDLYRKWCFILIGPYKNWSSFSRNVFFLLEKLQQRDSR